MNEIHILLFFNDFPGFYYQIESENTWILGHHCSMGKGKTAWFAQTFFEKNQDTTLTGLEEKYNCVCHKKLLSR
jgi:hypothetical protein